MVIGAWWGNVIGFESLLLPWRRRRPTQGGRIREETIFAL
jgi:hypothetical protein